MPVSSKHKINLKKLLLITKKLELKPRGGRELLCRLNYDAIYEVTGGGLHLLELPENRSVSMISTCRGYIDGYSPITVRAAIEIIDRHGLSSVFLDGSNLGSFAKEIKRLRPSIEIVTFFHNVESRFFLGSLLNRKTPRALAILIVNFFAEFKAVKHSDKLVCLSERDSRLLKKLYGRSATHISPMALQDKLPTNHEGSPKQPKEKFALFVGGVFYANRAGISWFVKHVVPHIQIKICILGKGFETLKQELEIEGKVEVVGAVDSLADWYRNAHFVIAPIFDGSGMKTKVAEALMYGKKVVGTPEAFSGYEDIADRAGHICESADDFVSVINIAKDARLKPFDSELRAIYQEKYSYPAARTRLAAIMDSVV